MRVNPIKTGQTISKWILGGACIVFKANISPRPGSGVCGVNGSLEIIFFYKFSFQVLTCNWRAGVGWIQDIKDYVNCNMECIWQKLKSLLAKMWFLVFFSFLSPPSTSPNKQKIAQGKIAQGHKHNINFLFSSKKINEV